MERKAIVVPDEGDETSSTEYRIDYDRRTVVDILAPRTAAQSGGHPALMTIRSRSRTVAYGTNPCARARR